MSPVGFVTFASRVDAETAKQELTVTNENPKDFMTLSSSLSIREFDLILIYLPHFDWNLRNRILKFKNPNIPPKIHLQLQPNNTFKFHVSAPFSIRSFIVKAFCSEELGAAFFPTEAWGQPLTFDLGPAGLHHPALLHTALHGPPMVGFFL